MKSFLKGSALACLMTLTLTGHAFAASSELAADKLSNVIQNSIPANYRPLLQEKLDAVRLDIAQLKTSLEKLENVSNNSLPKEYRESVDQKINSLELAIGKDLGRSITAPSCQPEAPKTSGKYCVAACKNSSGNVDSTRSVGIFSSGTSLLIAQQAASDMLARSYTCYYGATNVGCEDSTPGSKAVTCQVACSNSSGDADMSKAAIGQGAGELEAMIQASASLVQNYTCYYGTKKVACEK